MAVPGNQDLAVAVSMAACKGSAIVAPAAGSESSPTGRTGCRQLARLVKARRTGQLAADIRRYHRPCYQPCLRSCLNHREVKRVRSGSSGTGIRR